MGRRFGSAEQFSNVSEGNFSAAVGEETEMSDAGERMRQDMEQKAADELANGKCHGFECIMLFSIATRESNRIINHLFDAVIGDSDFMGIAGEIGKDMLGSGERLFCIDNPVCFIHIVDQ